MPLAAFCLPTASAMMRRMMLLPGILASSFAAVAVLSSPDAFGTFSQTLVESSWLASGGCCFRWWLAGPSAVSLRRFLICPELCMAASLTIMHLLIFCAVCLSDLLIHARQLFRRPRRPLRAFRSLLNLILVVLENHSINCDHHAPCEAITKFRCLHGSTARPLAIRMAAAFLWIAGSRSA